MLREFKEFKEQGLATRSGVDTMTSLHDHSLTTKDHLKPCFLNPQPMLVGLIWFRSLLHILDWPYISPPNPYYYWPF